MKHPKLRDSNETNRSNEPYPLNEIPTSIVKRIAAYIVYLIAIGRPDISGNDWGDAFAYAIRGKHLASPLGIADVELNRMAWSLKTVKVPFPFKTNSVRLISGRCSPDYSYGITDPHNDIQATGNAVLGIWNERLNIAQENYTPLRTCVMLRNKTLDEFLLFEQENLRYPANEYVWKENKNGNLIAYNRHDSRTTLTWQPHGAQFTIHTPIPSSSTRFTLKKPHSIDVDQILSSIGYSEQWVDILP